MRLEWTKTDIGYYARGAATNYNINRTPGHRFWLVVDGAEVRQGKLDELKGVAQANENAAGGTDDGPKSGTGRPTGNGKLRIKPKLSTPAATNPDQLATKVIPASAIHREHAAAVEATDPYSPDAIQFPKSPVVIVDVLTDPSTTDPVAWPPTPDDDSDGQDSDVDTPLVPNTPEPPQHDHGNPVGPASGGTRMHRFHTRAPSNVFRPFLRPQPPIIGQDGRPIRAWLGGVVR